MKVTRTGPEGHGTAAQSPSVTLAARGRTKLSSPV